MRWISWLSGVQLALDSIRESKLRAFLTVLGVIIGTGTIIGVGSIIAGLDGAVTNILRSFGTNTAIVFKFPLGFNSVSAEEVKRKPVSHDDALAIAARCPDVELVSPYLFPGAIGRGPQIGQ